MFLGVKSPRFLISELSPLIFKVTIGRELPIPIILLVFLVGLLFIIPPLLVLEVYWLTVGHDRFLPLGSVLILETFILFPVEIPLSVF